MIEDYRFDEGSYRAIGANGVGWQSVLDVLHHAPRRWRQHLGAVLRIAAADRDGRWLGVTVIEEDDDAYLVTTARWLTDAEAEQITRLLDGDTT